MWRRAGNLFYSVARSVLRRFRKHILMLAVADDEHALARPFAHHEFESLIGGISGDERDRAIVVLAGSDRTLPLAETECDRAALVEHRDFTELFAGITRCQLFHDGRISRYHQPLALLDDIGSVGGRSARDVADGF